jgi:hypothetical protein
LRPLKKGARVARPPGWPSRLTNTDIRAAGARKFAPEKRAPSHLRKQKKGPPGWYTEPKPHGGTARFAQVPANLNTRPEVRHRGSQLTAIGPHAQGSGGGLRQNETTGGNVAVHRPSVSPGFPLHGAGRLARLCAAEETFGSSVRATEFKSC